MILQAIISKIAKNIFDLIIQRIVMCDENNKNSAIIQSTVGTEDTQENMWDIALWHVG